MMCSYFWHEKVADLEKEVENQKEYRLMYRKRLERTQDYLRYLLGGLGPLSPQKLAQEVRLSLTLIN
jgi:hypothetical protein